MHTNKHCFSFSDLMSMMMQCSDLNAPQKAKGFHKPSLMEVQKTGFHHGSKTTEVHHESDHARRWDNTQELEGLFIMESECCFILFFHSSCVMRMYLGLCYPLYNFILSVKISILPGLLNSQCRIIHLINILSSTAHSNN